MPLIEELPVTAPMRVSHGWAYVPDTGPIPAMAPPGARKRNRQDAGTTNATATAKLQKSIQQRLESLDRENYKDGVVVPIPTRSKSSAGEAGGATRTAGKKLSNNVRRILTYQRTFQHYLADEEAGMSGGGGAGHAATSSGASVAQGASQSASARNEGRRKSGAVSAAVAPPVAVTDAMPKSTSNRRGRRRESEVIAAAIPPVAATPSPNDTPTGRRRGPGRPSRSSTIKQEEDIVMTDTETPAATQDAPGFSDDQNSSITPSQDPPSTISSLSNTTARPLYDPKLDNHPLLRTLDLPKQPSARILDILLSEPPLSYTAARAASSIPASDSILEDGNKEKHLVTAKPQRHFCALCGYWGKVKCRKCGEWTCGLMECWKGHEGVCIAMGMY